MPNPVVSFEIRGGDTAALRDFYAAAFGWEMFTFPSGYALVETASHEHSEDERSVYTGDDAFMNDGVVVGSQYGQPAWKFQGEHDWRMFAPGVDGGIGQGEARVTIYVQVPDIGAILARVVGLGGVEIQPATEVAPGVVTGFFADPAGNHIGLILRPQHDG
jgi:predicted enzyme related to lactoylglutathione lyase